MSATATPPLAELHALFEREQIRETIYRVSRAMDRADEALFRSCYQEDAWDDHGYFKGPVSEFRPGSIFRPPNVLSVNHFMGNILIELAGDVATAESYYLANQRAESDGKLVDTSFGGRYVDRFEKRGGVWKIAHRMTIFDWTRIDPVDQLLTIEGAMTGAASREDYSYLAAAR